MRNPEDVARTKALIVRQLVRKDIGVTHQRAMLHGILCALEWCQGVSDGNARAVQRLADGEEIAADAAAVIGGKPLRSAVGRAGRPDLVRRYQLTTGDTNLAGYVAWLESQVTGVGLVVV